MTLLADHRRRAAHDKHVCRECRRRIPRGERYVDQRIADYGTIYTYRAHERCYRIVCAHVLDLEDWYSDVHELLDGHTYECAGATHPDFAGCDCKAAS